MKTFVIGDIHGAHKALIQCLERSGFNYQEDKLISLGDVADGWSQVFESFEELMKIKNLVYIMGNHDFWLLQWFKTGQAPNLWVNQGGKATLASYVKAYELHSTLVKERHQSFLDKAQYYYVDEENRVFVHGGFDWHDEVGNTSNQELMWDRELFQVACMWQEWNDRGQELTMVKRYKEVFIGHTTTSWYKKDLLPVHVSNVWNLDQGGGWEGKLTIMNVETKEFWQSDVVKTLYPEEKGRG